MHKVHSRWSVVAGFFQGGSPASSSRPAGAGGLVHPPNWTTPLIRRGRVDDKEALPFVNSPPQRKDGRIDGENGCRINRTTPKILKYMSFCTRPTHGGVGIK